MRSATSADGYASGAVAGSGNPSHGDDALLIQDACGGSAVLAHARANTVLATICKRIMGARRSCVSVNSKPVLSHVVCGANRYSDD